MNKTIFFTIVYTFIFISISRAGLLSDDKLIALPNSFSKLSDQKPQWKETFILFNPVSENIEQEDNRVEDIPLIIRNAKIQNSDAPIALLISGDGGWYAFEELLADHMSKLGIPTIGLDSRKYFWKRKSPEEVAKDMATCLNYYRKVWGKEKFILIGYSLGAEIVPFIVNKLPGPLKSKISSAVLLSPDITTDFEVHFSNMLGMGNSKNTYNVIEEIIKMQNVPTLIIFGDGEKTRFSDLLNKTSVKITFIPGDHHYKFNMALIIQTMKENKVF